MAYDLEMPRGLQPLCSDGEVEEFRMLPMGEVLAAEANPHPERMGERSEECPTPFCHRASLPCAPTMPPPRRLLRACLRLARSPRIA